MAEPTLLNYQQKVRVPRGCLSFQSNRLILKIIIDLDATLRSILRVGHLHVYS